MYLVWGLARDGIKSQQRDSCCAKKMQRMSGNMFLHTEKKTHGNTSVSIHMAAFVVHLAQHAIYSYQPIFPVVFAPHDAARKVKIKGRRLV